MTFLPFLLNRSRLPICSYNFFLFWPVPLKSVKKKKKKKKYSRIYIDKQNHLKKKKVLFFSILACNTSNTKWLIYSLSQHLKRLANDFPAFFAYTCEGTKKKKVLFFSILACNTSNTKWLIYSLSQHLTRLANDFPAFFA